MEICHAKLQEGRFWENAFRDRAIALQADLAKLAPAAHHIDISDDSDTDDQVNIIPADPVVDVSADKHIIDAPEKRDCRQCYAQC